MTEGPASRVNIMCAVGYADGWDGAWDSKYTHNNGEGGGWFG